MAKYYVESGTLQLVVIADDARRAALWAVHRAMQQVAPIDDVKSDTPEQKESAFRRHGCLVLGGRLKVNERGFGRPEGARYDTFEIVTEWNQLMIAVARLEASGFADDRDDGTSHMN